MAKQTASPAAPSETIRIRATQATACHTVEGACLDMKKGDVLEVPRRAGEYLIRNKKAELVAS